MHPRVFALNDTMHGLYHTPPPSTLSSQIQTHKHRLIVRTDPGFVPAIHKLTFEHHERGISCLSNNWYFEVGET